MGEVKGKWTPKLERFVDEYFINGMNATKAAIAAGYSKKSASTIAAENMQKPHVRARIEERLAQMDKKRIMQAEEVLEHLTRIALGQEKEQVLMGIGKGAETKTHVEVSAKDRIKALELLGKAHAVFTDKQKVETNQVIIVDDSGDAE
uniref:Terminase small subunit n=3 Tax=Caudoviricetes TaxID=2731619 RepID=TERS_BPSPP|nr:RecName: Full=Terminase small subunit; AltName: Full=G1P; AltName: Full=Terminase, small subunit gp1 [Bacillus phage SPP1]AQN32169.1 terminase small subunit [Bacillus phage 41C]CAK29440.1 terminase small subunit [Bacillus phage SPP1]